MAKTNFSKQDLSREDQLRLEALAKRQLANINRRRSFDPDNPKARPTGPQSEVIQDFGKVKQQWIVSGNRAGKSHTCARLVAWFLEEKETELFQWKRPAEWGDKPTTSLVICQSSKIGEVELWENKLKRMLEPGTYKEIRSGNILQRIVMDNGNSLVFQSMENVNEARKRIQTMTLQLVWQDEMPSSDSLIAEAIMRTMTSKGYYLASFTPLLVNQKIRQRVDSAPKAQGKKYQFSMFDNPVFDDKQKQEYLASNAHLSPAELKARIYGEWISPENAVYYWDSDQMLVPAPVHYSHMWRHVLSVDPGSNSPTGMGIFAEDPFTGNWYLMKCWYLTIAEPNALVQKVKELSSPYNIVKRVVDSGYSSWFREIAKMHGMNFVYPPDKTHSRKMELIKQLQFALGGKLFITDSPDTQVFVDEVTSCHWADTENVKIAKASRFHVLDMAQYFVDLIPKFEGPKVPEDWWTPMRQQQEDEMNGKDRNKSLKHRTHIDIKKNAVRRSRMGKWK